MCSRSRPAPARVRHRWPPAGPERLLPEKPAARRPTGTTVGPGAEPLVAQGQLIAVWGPAGAPGRTTVAVGLASELAAGGLPVLLVDADPYGGCIAQLLGLLEEAPGVAAAARAANAGTLDVPHLASLARTVSVPGGSALRVLTGISRAARWTELRPAAVTTVHTLARRLAAVTVVDCGFSLEQDEELTYDTAAPQRNGATLAAVDAADLVLAVGSADPVGLTRLVRGLAELRALSPPGRVQLVVNRLRTSSVPGVARPEAVRREVEQVLVRHAGMRPLMLIPLDQAAADRALAHGRLLCDVAADSPARLALTELAATVVGSPWRRARPAEAPPFGPCPAAGGRGTLSPRRTRFVVALQASASIGARTPVMRRPGRLAATRGEGRR